MQSVGRVSPLRAVMANQNAFLPASGGPPRAVMVNQNAPVPASGGQRTARPTLRQLLECASPLALWASPNTLTDFNMWGKFDSTANP
jgi:hypothetical protein